MRAGQAGQATVETVAVAPLVAAVVLSVAQLLAAGAADELAGHAAEAGAVALLERRDAQAAVRDALPGWARDRVRATVRGERVEVAVRPPSPIGAVADLLTATASAQAGSAR